MKSINLSLAIAGTTLAGLAGFMLASNPGSAGYENYATEKLSSYLINDGCPQLSSQQEIPEKIAKFVEKNCISIVKSNRSQIEKIVANNTKRQNFLFFSVYRTDFAFRGSLPDYHFETVGLFQNYYLYKAEKL